MFQNIITDIEREEIEKEDSQKKLKIKLSLILKKQTILLYIISFMLSIVSFGNDINVFAIAIFAATCSNNIPVGILYIITLIGTLIKFGNSGLIYYLLNSFLFMALILIFRAKIPESTVYNEKRKLGKYVFISTFFVQAIYMIFNSFMVYDLLLSIVTSIAAYIFYKIFSNSIIVINEFKIKKAFSIEEIIGASILLSIAISCFGELAILGFQIKNIISILIVLILGWKNGMLIGATSGIAIGTVLGIITNSNPILIAVYALSGMLSGLLSKFGKVGVIVGFVAGNLLITYVLNGNIVEIIYFKEIIVASLGLLLVPERIKIEIEDLFGNDNLLEETGKYRLEESKETIEKLNNVSDVIQEMSNTYKQVAATVIEEDNNACEKNKEIFIEEFQKNLNGLENNILYEDLISIDEVIISDIFNYINENGRITTEDLIEIFKMHNNYIFGFDDYQTNLKIERDVKDIIKIINESYKISKVNFIWKKKIDENKKVMSEQLDGVSKAISSIVQEFDKNIKYNFENEKKEIISRAKVKNINILDVNIKRQPNDRYIVNTYIEKCNEDIKECPNSKVEKILSDVLKDDIVIQKEKCAIKQQNNICKQTYLSKDRYRLQIGMSKTTKDKSSVSGDSFIQAKLSDGKNLIALSDGMGSGPEARKSSQIAIKMLARLLSNGFDKDTSLELINSTIFVNSEKETFATVDATILDLYSGNIEFIKNGACPTFIKNKKQVQVLKTLSLPAGILNNIDLVVYDKDLEDGDIIVMCTDGVLESNAEYNNKEIWVKNILEEIETDNVQKIADILIKESIDNNYGLPKDDMTVIVIKVVKSIA